LTRPLLEFWMHICFITTGDLMSIATGKRATGMAAPLAALGHRVSIIIQETPLNRERLALECPAAEALFFPADGPAGEVRHKRALLRQARPDVIYVCAYGVRNMVLGPGARRRSVRLVEHSELRSGIPGLPFLQRRCDRALELLSALTFDGQVCASHTLEREYAGIMRRLRRPRPLLYLPYAYSEEVLLPPKVDMSALQERYAGRQVLLYMGTLTANYGLFHMLEAAERLRQSRRDFVLLMLGRGRHAEQAAEFVAAHRLEDAVELLGYVPEAELAGYFRLASAFLMPLMDTVQDWARCPSKLFMYLPFEKPIVTSPIGEALDHLGDDGFYFQPGDVAGLAVQLDRALAAAPTWRPTRDFHQHAWRERAKAFAAWLEQHWGDRFAAAADG